MPRETVARKKERFTEILRILRRTYPDAHCELNFTNPLQLLVATILSAQSTDKQVNIVTTDLFKKYRSAQDFANADPAQLEEDLRRIGLFRNKAKNIKKCAQALVDQHRGEVPREMSALVELGGVGRKTANVVLGNAFNINEGVVVDTHVARLSQRLGITTSEDPVKIEIELQRWVPREDWTLLSHWLIWHGRRRCFARNPECPKCEVLHLCPTGQSALRVCAKTNSDLARRHFAGERGAKREYPLRNGALTEEQQSSRAKGPIGKSEVIFAQTPNSSDSLATGKPLQKKGRIE